MLRRSVTCLLLVTLLGWSTGLAQAVHVRLDHGNRCCAALHRHAQHGTLPCDHPKPQGRDCAICQFLAAPIISPVAPPPVVALAAAPGARLSISPEVAPVLVGAIEHAGHDPPPPL